MMNTKNVLKFNRKAEKNTHDDAVDEIIDDSALIDCINQLHSLRDAEHNEKYNEKHNISNNAAHPTEKDVLDKINRINAEMSWFSQWLTVKSNSAA